MPNATLEDIQAKIQSQHKGDARQLEVIFSENRHLVVEAPAGYGKTKTMISRIAYLVATDRIPNPKHILTLTFSINAALKVKRDAAKELPALLGRADNPEALSEKVTVTNYHGFCKGVLKKYGYLASVALCEDVNRFKALGKIKNGNGVLSTEWKDIAKKLTLEEQEAVHIVDISIENGLFPSEQEVQAVLDAVRKLLPLGFITHNAVILFVLDIFERFPEVRKFYQCYYPLIVVDEFQDTNCIAWKLLESIIDRDRSQLLFLGDPLQRIYGFIGALPNIMGIVVGTYNMTRVALETNHRFQNNPEMLKLDKNIRANAAASFSPTIAEDDVAQLPAFWSGTQQEEAQKIASKVQSLIADSQDRVTILFRLRSLNADALENELAARRVPYFYGMFADEDPDYVDFHIKCQDIFIRKFGKSKTVSLKALEVFAGSVKAEYAASAGKTIDSLFRLLNALVVKVSADYAALPPADRYNLLLDVFENRQIKQAMEYVDAQVILCTVHGAKGLEWEYVILADFERSSFTSYYSCRECQNKDISGTKCRCHLPAPIPARFQKTALDELSIFYVGVTRAKKAAFVSASAKQLTPFGSVDTLFSCMASINGIRLLDGGSVR